MKLTSLGASRSAFSITKLQESHSAFSGDKELKQLSNDVQLKYSIEISLTGLARKSFFLYNVQYVSCCWFVS